MRDLGLAGVVMLVGLAGPAQAGLYPTLPPEVAVTPSLRFDAFYQSFLNVRSLAVEGNPNRKADLEQVAKLMPGERGDSLSVEERVRLSAYLIRLGDYEQARRVLGRLERDGQDNFMVLANLALLNQLTGQSDRAVEYQRRALKAWPTRWPGWTTVQINAYRRAEEYFLKLLSFRRQEARTAPSRAGEDLAGLTESLFPGVRFVGDGGAYEPGRVAAASRDKLPDDALPVAQQLLLWLALDPDQRLTWLVGEICNATGQVAEAAKVFNALVDSGYNAGELRRHRQVVNAARALLPAVKDGQVSHWLSPRPSGPAAPAAGLLLEEAARAQVTEELKRRQDPLAGVAASAVGVTPTVETGSPQQEIWPGFRRTALVGAVVVAALLVLAYLQGFLAGRRRPASAPPKR